MLKCNRGNSATQNLLQVGEEKREKVETRPTDGRSKRGPYTVQNGKFGKLKKWFC